MSDQKWKTAGENPEEDFNAGFKIPDTRSILERINTASKDALKQEHKEETNALEKAGKAKKKQRRGGQICCCEDPNCRIGPMMEKSPE